MSGHHLYLLLGSHLSGSGQAQLATAVSTPGEQKSGRCDSSGVSSARRQLRHRQRPQAFHQRGAAPLQLVVQAELPERIAAPGVDLQTQQAAVLHWANRVVHC